MNGPSENPLTPTIHFLPARITLNALQRDATALGLPSDLARQHIAHRYGFLTWRQLAVHVDHPVPREDADFLHLACLNYHHDRPVFRQQAREMLVRNPSLAVRDIWHAACVGAADEVAGMLDADPSLIDARDGWFDWEPLLYAAYSRLDLPGRSTLVTARLLVECGANPDVYYMWGGDCRFTALTGAFGEGEQGPVNQPPHPEWEEFARLLLDAGADPNDGQALYNRMFSRDDRCLEMLFEYGLNPMPRRAPLPTQPKSVGRELNPRALGGTPGGRQPRRGSTSPFPRRSLPQRRTRGGPGRKPSSR